MIKICKECGLEFDAANSSQRFCRRDHYRICCVCGKKFLIPNKRLPEKDSSRTCSKECSAVMRRSTNFQRYGGPAPASSSLVQEKMRQTNLDRYGVEYAAQSEEMKEKSKQTSLERYGVEFHSQTEESREAIRDRWKNDDYKNKVRNSIIQTNLDRYGVDNPMKNPDVRSRMTDSYMKKTGYAEPLSNPDVISKSKQTLLAHYGVEHPLQSKDIMNRAIATNNKRYGYDNPMQDINVQRKVQTTCLERYGNTCYLQSDLGKEQIRNTNNKKYNSDYFVGSRDWLIRRMTDPSKIDNLMEFSENPSSFIDKYYDHNPSIRELSRDLGISDTSVGSRLLSTDEECRAKIAYTYSYMESEVFNSLVAIDSNMKILRNVHNIIAPYELDIYLPEYRLAIECNPTSTHNSSVNTFDRSASPTPYNYHMKKTNLCEENDVFLFHIFGSEWTYSKHIIESMLRSLVNKTENKVYARSCEVRHVSSEDCKQFLDNNHRQGSSSSSIRLGLYHNDELVSIMTFGKMRNSIGTSKYEDLSDCWELVRFCSKLDTSVVGGASKLFKHFIQENNPNRIRSFSDRAHTKGNLYKTLGFTELRKSDPGYVWVDGRTDISYHRYCAQKQNIQKFLHDDTIDLSRSEKQIMEEHGFVQVFDSGTITWEWISTKQ